MKQFESEKYVSVKTFKKSGEGVAAPVWMTVIDDRLFFTTPTSSFKVVRIRNNPNVEVAASDARGNVHSEWAAGTARILDDAEFSPARKSVHEKYRFTWWMFGLYVRVKRLKLIGIEVTGNP